MAGFAGFSGFAGLASEVAAGGVWAVAAVGLGSAAFVVVSTGGISRDLGGAAVVPSDVATGGVSSDFPWLATPSPARIATTAATPMPMKSGDLLLRGASSPKSTSLAWTC